MKQCSDYNISLYAPLCCFLIGCSDREEIYIGDDNSLTLEVVAENHGEGAYEAELHVFPPQQADFIEVVRSQVTSCSDPAGHLIPSRTKETLSAVESCVWQNFRIFV